MGKESLREHIFKKWQAKFPDKFPPDKPLSAYIELDEDTGEPLCGRLTGCLSTGREITETATRVASPVHRNNGHVY
ncbi:hypothetical protein HY468_00420, partial [Candidatus Roizmanbacteria bacterium]|nr:hypothetical protein [Candidatus Roizmanbacteria bacterium]